jgi:hypothetical protein
LVNLDWTHVAQDKKHWWILEKMEIKHSLWCGLYWQARQLQSFQELLGLIELVTINVNLQN